MQTIRNVQRTIWAAVGVGVALLLSAIPARAGWLDGYACLEVTKFTVDRTNYTSRANERAAAIPDEMLADLQHKIVGEIFRMKLLPAVKKDAACTGKTLVLSGRVTDYKKGNRLARYTVGFGAGKQKFEVATVLTEKSSGEVVRQKVIVDRKFGGFAGGDADQGQRDFAEKVAKFVKLGK